jgi:hypothetical protein
MWANRDFEADLGVVKKILRLRYASADRFRLRK